MFFRRFSRGRFLGSQLPWFLMLKGVLCFFGPFEPPQGDLRALPHLCPGRSRGLNGLAEGRSVVSHVSRISPEVGKKDESTWLKRSIFLNFCSKMSIALGQFQRARSLCLPAALQPFCGRS